MWDQRCADLAWEHCPDLPGCQPPTCPGEGDCCQASDTPFCSDAACCNAVCDIDPYCCEVEWDICCAELAAETCPHPIWPEVNICDPPPMCGPGNGPCEQPNDTPGCDGGTCCGMACANDPFCCEVQWDGLCVDAMCNLPECMCDHCPTIVCDPICIFTNPQGFCFTPGGTGCFDFDCCEAVCACDPFCCLVQWDDLCVGPNLETGCSATNLCCHLIECNPADLTLSNTVGVDDLLLLLASWGDCPTIDEHCPDPADCPADFNDDLTVGVDDLLFLLENWSD